jgi:hypothetical protein
MCVYSLRHFGRGELHLHGHILNLAKTSVVCTPSEAVRPPSTSKTMHAPLPTHPGPQPHPYPCAPSFYSCAPPSLVVRALPSTVHTSSTAMRAFLLPVHAPSLPCMPPFQPCTPLSPIGRASLSTIRASLPIHACPSFTRARPLPAVRPPPTVHAPCCHLRPIDFVQLLLWKSTSPLPMSC